MKKINKAFRQWTILNNFVWRFATFLKPTKKWEQITLTFWMLKGTKNILLDEVRVYRSGKFLMGKPKKWWEFWKK